MENLCQNSFFFWLNSSDQTQTISSRVNKDISLKKETKQVGNLILSGAQSLRRDSFCILRNLNNRNAKMSSTASQHYVNEWVDI